MLVTSSEIVQKAYEQGYAVPAINTQGGNYDIIRSICLAAEETGSPVILAHYIATGAYAGNEWFAEVAKYWARKVSIPVAIHLDHGDHFKTCVEALQMGFTSIMLDCSKESIAENILHTNEVIRVCHALEIPVEAEVGELVRLDAAGAAMENKNLADAADVKEFLAGCRPDMLAIGIGNAHGFYKGRPNIRLDILKQIREIADIPLVLHGCTGMPDEIVREAVGLGMAKINFGTLVRHKYLEYFQEGIETLDHQGHSWKVSQFAELKLREIIKDIINYRGRSIKRDQAEMRTLSIGIGIESRVTNVSWASVQISNSRVKYERIPDSILVSSPRSPADGPGNCRHSAIKSTPPGWLRAFSRRKLGEPMESPWTTQSVARIGGRVQGQSRRPGHRPARRLYR